MDSVLEVCKEQLSGWYDSIDRLRVGGVPRGLQGREWVNRPDPPGPRCATRPVTVYAFMPCHTCGEIVNVDQVLSCRG